MGINRANGTGRAKGGRWQLTGLAALMLLQACEAARPADDPDALEGAGGHLPDAGDAQPQGSPVLEGETGQPDAATSMATANPAQTREGMAPDAAADAAPPDEPTDTPEPPAQEPPRPVVHGGRFVDVTAQAGVAYRQGPEHDWLNDDFYAQLGLVSWEQWINGGAAAGDFDADGWIDLYVTRVDGPGILFRNLGDGTFEDATDAAGLSTLSEASNGAGFADVDNDGDLDLYVTTLGAPSFYLFINSGGVFSEEAVLRGAGVADDEWRGGYSVSFGDYDLDGWIDIHVNELKWMLSGKNTSHTRLLHNLGATGSPGHFEDTSIAAGVFFEPQTGAQYSSLTYTSAFSDLDDDGWPELVISSDHGTSALFWNDRDGTFTNGTEAAGVGTDTFGMGLAIGDYDGDGRLDLFVTSIYGFFADVPADYGNRLYRNNGDRTFSDHTDSAGVRDSGWGWGNTFFDMDNDADLDLVATNGYGIPGNSLAAYHDDPTRLWENDAQGGMQEVAVAAGIDDRGDGKGLLVFDYDNDGDQDLFIVNHAGGPRLYRNDLGDENDWLRVRLQGKTSNRQGLGAKLSVQVDTESAPLVRELRAGSNCLGQNESIAHFGLGVVPGATLAKVEIAWPTPGGTRKLQTLRDVPVNQLLEVVEPD